MQGQTMWIILGALIAAVIIFLVVASVKDKKKNKKLKIEKEKIDKRKSSAGMNVAKKMLTIYKETTKMLKDFVPSVGKVKMADIRNHAKKELLKLERSIIYKDLSENEEQIKVILRKFKEVSPNTWEKKLQEELKSLNKFIEQYIKQQKEKMKTQNITPQKKFFKIFKWTPKGKNAKKTH